MIAQKNITVELLFLKFGEAIHLVQTEISCEAPRNQGQQQLRTMSSSSADARRAAMKNLTADEKTHILDELLKISKR